jgi:two-component system, cell cycle sensor histidine kinase and response regulator CckA
MPDRIVCLLPGALHWAPPTAAAVVAITGVPPGRLPRPPELRLVQGVPMFHAVGPAPHVSGSEYPAEVKLPQPPRRSSRAILARLRPLPNPGWRRYAVAVLASAVMLALRVPLTGIIGERLPFITFFFAVFVSAWYGGLGPAILSTVMGVAASLYILLPTYGGAGTRPEIAVIGTVLFSLTGLSTGWLGETRLHALRQAADAADQAAAEADRADEERERAEDEASRAEEAAAEAETAAQEAAEALERQLEAETALRRSEQELSDFFENATVGLLWIEPDGRIRRVNRALLAVLGACAEDLVGRHLGEFHVDPAVVDDLVARLDRGEVVYEVPARMKAGEGQVRDVMLSASGYLSEGKLVHGRVFVRDVTDQKRAEEAVRALQRLETVGRLAGGMAHEVNNQMTVVLGATDFILRRDDLPSMVRSDVQFIRDAAQRSAGITTQLLAFSRRQLLRPESLELHHVLVAFEPVLRRSVGGACEVVVEPSSGPTSIRVDRGQLEQVLLNLAINAADAMPNGGRLTLATRTVRLTDADPRLPLEPDVRAGEYVELVVRDTGTGMDETTLQRIFEPFFTTKGVGKGTGLGLSTVYGIVRQSGGYVGVTSEPGRGTAFALYLPVAPRSGATPVARGDGSGLTRQGELVLLVEDNPEVRRVAARALQEAGFTVREACDGVEALSALERLDGTVDLVLTDLALPNMDGLELVRELARRVPRLPVLLMTGYTSAESTRRAAMADGFRVVGNPFTADVLVREVRDLLDGSTDSSPRYTS